MPPGHADEGRDEAADPELRRTDQRRRAAGDRRLDPHRERGRVRQHETDARDDGEEAHEHRDEARAREHRDEQRDAARRAQIDAALQHRGGAEAPDEPPVDPAERHDADGVAGEHAREGERREPVDVLQHERGPGDVRGHRGEREAPGQHVAAERTVADQRVYHPPGLGQATAEPALGRERLRDARRRADQDEQAADRERDEDRPPLAELQDEPAEHRRDDRSRAADKREQRVALGGLGCRKAVAHHRPRDHDPGRSAEPLQQAQHEQHPDAGREHRAERRQHEHDEARDQRATPSDRVADRPEHELSGREAGHAGGQRQLPRRGGRREIAGQRRQRRQVHVHRQRPEHRESAEQHDEARAGEAASRRKQAHARRV